MFDFKKSTDSRRSATIGKFVRSEYIADRFSNRSLAACVDCTTTMVVPKKFNEIMSPGEASATRSKNTTNNISKVTHFEVAC